MKPRRRESWLACRTIFALLLAVSSVRAVEPGRLAPVLASVTNLLRATTPEPLREVKLPGDVTARTAIIRRTQWDLKHYPQSSKLGEQWRREAMALPEAERHALMNRFDDFSQLWVVPLDAYPGAGAALKATLPPCAQTNRYHREFAFLGKGAGFAWYGLMPIHDWTRVQKELQLTEGDDPLAAAVRGISVNDPGSMTRNSAEGMLAVAGSRAIPYLREILASTNFSRALYTLGWTKGDEATVLLLEAAISTNRDMAAAARHVLEWQPRPAAESLYLQWLEQDAGKKPVTQLLQACEQLDSNKLARYLPRIIESPQSVREFRHAFEMLRSSSGKPIPAGLLKLEEEIKSAGDASSTNFDQAKAVHPEVVGDGARSVPERSASPRIRGPSKSCVSLDRPCRCGRGPSAVHRQHRDAPRRKSIKPPPGC